jgi:hypothetical protein
MNSKFLRTHVLFTMNLKRSPLYWRMLKELKTHHEVQLGLSQVLLLNDLMIYNLPCDLEKSRVGSHLILIHADKGNMSLRVMLKFHRKLWEIKPELGTTFCKYMPFEDVTFYAHVRRNSEVRLSRINMAVLGVCLLLISSCQYLHSFPGSLFCVIHTSFMAGNKG